MNSASGLSQTMQDKVIAEKALGEIADHLLKTTNPDVESRQKLQGLNRFSLSFSECLYGKNLIKLNKLIAIFPDEYFVAENKNLQTRIIKVKVSDDKLLARIKQRAVQALVSSERKELDIFGISDTAWDAIVRHTEALRREQDNEETQKLLQGAKRPLLQKNAPDDSCCDIL